MAVSPWGGLTPRLPPAPSQSKSLLPTSIPGSPHAPFSPLMATLALSPQGPGGRCRCPRSTAAEPPPRVMLSQPLSATQLSPHTSHAAADGGGDICLRVTCLMVAVFPLLFLSSWMEDS